MRLSALLFLGLLVVSACRETPADEQPDVTADVEAPQDTTLDLGWDPDTKKELTGNERWIQPPLTARITFYVDDRANKTFQDGEMKWTGSFTWDDKTNTILYADSWLPTDGPYPLLYDDGPISEGGHEMEGATAGDSIFSAEVWLVPVEDKTFNYGVLNELDFWMWEGANGEFTTKKGNTDLIEAKPLVLAPFGNIDFKVTVDVNNLNPAFDYVTEFSAVNVYLKGSVNMWTPLQILDAGPDANKGDDVAEDGIYTYVQGLNLGKHTGRLAEGQKAQFNIMFSEGEQTWADATEYKILSEGQQKGASEGIKAYIKCTEAEGWKQVAIEYELDSWGSTLNTTITATCGAVEPECTEANDTCGAGKKCIGGFCQPWCDDEDDCTGGQKCVDNKCKTVIEVSEPVITAIDPVEGPVEGGTVVTLTGTDFVDGATVAFGVTKATQVMVAAGGTSLTCTAPARPGGLVDVSITNPDGGTFTLTGAFTYTAENPEPTITEVDPAEGPVDGGTTVTIKGTSFLPAPEVKFGDVPATDVFFMNSTQIQAKSPAGALGKVAVTVMNSDGKSAQLPDAFEYIPNVIDYARLLPPMTIKALAGDNAPTVYAEVYEVGVTIGAGVGAGITAQVGYGPLATDPSTNPALWTWEPAVYDSDSGNNDVYRAVLQSGDPGDFLYAFRFTLDGTNWTYADGNGTADGFSPLECGEWENLDPAGGPYLFEVLPGVSSVLGGGEVSVKGAGFTAQTKLFLNGAETPSAYVSPTELIFVAPAHEPGYVSLGVGEGDQPDAELEKALLYVLKFTPTMDGDLEEWPDAFEIASNSIESNWDDSLNFLRSLYVSFDAQYLYIAWTGSCEETNYIVGYLDTDYGVGTGVREMTSLADNSGSGDLDDALSNVLTVMDTSFGAEFAFGTGGMTSFAEGSDLGLSVKSGWRRLTPTDNFPWLDGAVTCTAAACEARIKLSTIVSGSFPASGKQFALFLRLTNGYGGPEGISNQALPGYFDAEAPDKVGNLVKVDVVL